MKVTKAIIMGCSMMALSTMTEALTVIYDSGNTLPISDYAEAIQYEDKQVTTPSTNTPKVFTPSFPLSTPEMRPGLIEPRTISLPHLHIPFFIIGNDGLSKQWLIERREELLSLNAVGMLVEVKSLDELNVIRRLGTGLQIYPASGHDVATQLQLHHYPVLISSKSIEQ